MQIYINVEISKRELDSALFVGYIAAQAGHDVHIFDQRDFPALLSRAALRPGVFFTKSIHSEQSRVRLFQELKRRGFVITSIDQESGILNDSFHEFGKERFAPETMELADRVYCWGEREFEYLNQRFPQHSAKIQLTGSPRVDFWRRPLSLLGSIPEEFKERPYILISSNFGISNYYPYWEVAKGLIDSEASQYGIEELRGFFQSYSSEFLLQIEFVALASELANSFPDIDIVVRPHPTENPDSWRDLLPQRANLHVSNDGSITPWIDSAIAVIHNSCTSAIEATIAGKPVITFRPFDQLAREFNIPNRFGSETGSISETIAAVKSVLDSSHEAETTLTNRELLESLLFLPPEGSSAALIVQDWAKFEKTFPKRRRVPLLFGLVGWLLHFRRLFIALGFDGEGRKAEYRAKKFDPLSLASIRVRLNELSALFPDDSPVRISRPFPRGLRIYRQH